MFCLPLAMLVMIYPLYLYGLLATVYMVFMIYMICVYRSTYLICMICLPCHFPLPFPRDDLVTITVTMVPLHWLLYSCIVKPKEISHSVSIHEFVRDVTA